MYVLISAFCDGESVVPVQFEVEELYSANSALYLTVVLTKIDTKVLEETPADVSAGDTSPLFSMSIYSLRSIFENVNPADGRFLKYVPDAFLNDAQLKAKREALQKQSAEYANYRKEAKSHNEFNTGDGSVCYVRDWCENSCKSGNLKFRQMKMEFRYNLGGSDVPPDSFPI